MGTSDGVLDAKLYCAYNQTTMKGTNTQNAVSNFSIPLRKPHAHLPHPRLSFIRIPCNSDRPEIKAIDLTGACPIDYIFDGLEKHKEWLKDNLNILNRDDDTKTFNWDYSTLVGVSADSLGKDSGEWRADYVMLTCQNQNAGKYSFKHISCSNTGGLREISLEQTASGTCSGRPILRDCISKKQY